MQIYKVLPNLGNERQLKMWHKALRSQWSAADIDWTRPQRIQDKRFKDQMGRLLTPILMGEQAALYSVAGLIPVLGKTSEFETQLYLTTWAVDEGRHTELFARYYGRIDREPLSIRKFPSGYLFQSTIVSRDAAEWLAGVLVSEVLAKKVMEEFVRLDLDPVLSDIADGILIDEARHLGFNHIYLEDRHPGGADDEQAAHLHGRLSHVLAQVSPILEALATETKDIGIDADRLLHELGEETRRRLDKSLHR